MNKRILFISVYVAFIGFTNLLFVNIDPFGTCPSTGGQIVSSNQECINGMNPTCMGPVYNSARGEYTYCCKPSTQACTYDPNSVGSQIVNGEPVVVIPLNNQRIQFNDVNMGQTPDFNNPVNVVAPIDPLAFEPGADPADAGSPIVINGGYTGGTMPCPGNPAGRLFGTTCMVPVPGTNPPRWQPAPSYNPSQPAQPVTQQQQQQQQQQATVRQLCPSLDYRCIGEKVAAPACGHNGDQSCYDHFLRLAGVAAPRTQYDNVANLPDPAQLDAEAEKCKAQAKTSVSCCKQIDQCLVSTKPDEVDSTIGAILESAHTLMAAGPNMQSPNDLKKFCEKPSDFGNIVNGGYGLLRARTCDNYRAQCDQACSSNKSNLQNLVRVQFTENKCSSSDSQYYVNLFSEKFRLGCENRQAYVTSLSELNEAKMSCGQATLVAASSDQVAGGSLAAFMANNSKQSEQFRAKCREMMAATLSTGLPVDGVVTDCRDPKFRGGAQCQACLANPALANCQNLAGIPKLDPNADKPSLAGPLVNDKKDFSIDPSTAALDPETKIPAEEPKGVNAGQGSSGGVNLGDGSSGNSGLGGNPVNGKAGTGGARFGYVLADPQGFGAIGGFAGAGGRGIASTFGAVNKDGSVSQQKLDWNKYLPGGALYGKRNVAGLAGGAKLEVYGPSADIFKMIHDRYYSMCKRGQFLNSCP